MPIKLIQRASWRGEVTIVPAFAGVYRSNGASRVLDGLKAGAELGEMTAVRDGDSLHVLLSLGKREKHTPDGFRRAGGLAARWLAKREFVDAAIDADICLDKRFDGGLAELCEGLELGAFRFDQYKSENDKSPAVNVKILAPRVTKAAASQVSRAAALAEAANTARRVAHEPPNVLHPASLAARAKRLCRGSDLRCKVLDESQLARLKMGGILAVGQGSDQPSRLIVIEYGGTAKGKPVVLVGKAITFDTGGYSIKPRDGIVGMKYDKCGGMAVLGTMLAVASLKPRTPVVGVIAAAENMVSGGAYRPDDIITTMSGKTVEIVSADAEGRMVLCDALTYAQESYQPRAIIDVATLTGGVVVALGAHRAGLFCNNDRLADALLAAGERTSELLWRLPMDDAYFELLKSTDADFKNSSTRHAHAIQGAVFLKQFVDPKVPWAHLDIAGVGDVDKDRPYCPKGATGFGVRLLAEYLSHPGR